MKQVLLLAAGLALTHGAFAQELVTIQTRPGVQQSFFRFRGGGRARSPLLLAFNWSAIRIPLLLVHHVDDQCPAAPYEEAERLGRRFALITVRGRKRAESARCEPLSAHGFFGKEPETLAAIAGWMLAKPLAREIQ